MASNFGISLRGEEQAIEASESSQNVSIEASESDGRSGSDEIEKPKHRFSEPWEDSDLILVVEDEKFHVHRLILSMNSPVFKTMFKSQFKEATSSEIPLPEKKANEMLDFLKRIYFQHNQEPVEITIENMEHLLKLSDEYEVKHIFDSCINFVENQPKTKENVMKLRKMAEKYNVNSVREDCDELLKNMKLKTLSETIHLEADLDRETVQHFLEQRIELLETVLDMLYPEFMGMVECLMWLLKDKQEVSWCKKHFTDQGKLVYPLNVDSEEIRECPSCDRMLDTLYKSTYDVERLETIRGGRKIFGKRTFLFKYASHRESYHFEFLASAIDDLCKIKHSL